MGNMNRVDDVVGVGEEDDEEGLVEAEGEEEDAVLEGLVVEADVAEDASAAMPLMRKYTHFSSTATIDASESVDMDADSVGTSGGVGRLGISPIDAVRRSPP